MRFRRETIFHENNLSHIAPRLHLLWPYSYEFSGAEPIWLRQFHFICYSHDLHILLVLRLPIHLKGELGNILYVIDLIRIAEDSGNFLKS